MATGKPIFESGGIIHFGKGNLYTRDTETGRMEFVGLAENATMKKAALFPNEVVDQVVEEAFGKSIVPTSTPGITSSFTIPFTQGEPRRMEQYSLISGTVPFQVICAGDQISIILSEELVLSIDNPIMVAATLERTTDWYDVLQGAALAEKVLIANEISLTLCLKGSDIKLTKGEEPAKLIVPQLIKSISVGEMLDIINDRIVSRRKKKR